MADDDFTAWLGHIGKDRPFRHELLKAANQAGRAVRSTTARARRFTGSRIGRGSGIGRLLGSSDRFGGDRARRVVVKARFVKLAGKGASAAAAHLRYLQRDGTTREGERGTLYGADSDAVDGKAFLERGKADRHQFRFIVAPEDGAEYADLKPVARRLMQQLEQDLGTRLEWVAVDHFNTGHPHTHILLRGIDEKGQNLVIAREYISRGIAMRAAEIVNLDLGPRTDREILLAAQRDMDAERFTRIDRSLLQDRNEHGFASAWHRDPAEQSLRAGRLTKLARLGLAREVGKGVYRLGGVGVERRADGSWIIAPDHLERVQAWESARAAKQPVRLELLSDRPLEQLARYDGATWLDEQCVASDPEKLQGGFGAKARRALDLRRQWLIEQRLAFEDQGTVRYQANVLQTLRRRELTRAGALLSQELGLDYAEHRGGRIEGTYRRPVSIGSSKYALVENARELTLVPWRPALEKQVGRYVVGIDRGGSISWKFGRDRSGPQI